MAEGGLTQRRQGAITRETTDHGQRDGEDGGKLEN